MTSYRHALIRGLTRLGWTQQRIAESLYLTQAAVSSYLKKDFSPEGLDGPFIDDLVNQAMSIMQQDPADTSAIMDTVCRACKIARSPGARLCESHMSEIPVLGDQVCTICSKYLDKTVLVMEGERRAIITELLESFHRLEHNKRYVSLIPEVQSNLVLGLKDPSHNDLEDYAGFPGRIIKHGAEAKALVTGLPAFGASKHIARLVSIVRKSDPTVRSATCVTYNKKIADAMNRLGWWTIHLEDENDAFAIDAALGAAAGKDVDAIVFKGIVGMEPLTYILGPSASVVIDKTEKLASFI